jgi:hypothetical protein
MTDEQFQIVVGLLSEIRDALVPPAEPVARLRHRAIPTIGSAPAPAVDMNIGA